MDWEHVLVSFFAAIPPTLGAIAALVVAIRNGQKTEANTQRVEDVHTQLNGRMSELLAASNKVSFTDGGDAEKAASSARGDIRRDVQDVKDQDRRNTQDAKDKLTR